MITGLTQGVNFHTVCISKVRLGAPYK